MNIKSIKKQLGKVNALFSVMENEEAISSIEKDLLKSYVQNLYAQIIDVETTGSDGNKVEIVESKVVHKQLVTSSPKQTFIEKINKEESEIYSRGEDKFSNEFLTDPIDEVSGTYNRQDSQVQPSSNGVVSTTATMIAPEVNGKNMDNSVMDLLESDQKIKALFAESKSSELSDRLRNTPIKDINAGLGLNERILMVNELFGKSNEIFKESVKKLNSLDSFADAKKYLVTNLIKTYEWTEDHKVHSAASFIKLVRRRYI